jgi:hypothetical protein
VGSVEPADKPENGRRRVVLHQGLPGPTEPAGASEDGVEPGEAAAEDSGGPAGDGTLTGPVGVPAERARVGRRRGLGARLGQVVAGWAGARAGSRRDATQRERAESVGFVGPQWPVYCAS